MSVEHRFAILIVEAIHGAGLRPGQGVGVACDPASSEFYENDQYRLRSEDRRLDSAAMTAYYAELVVDNPLRHGQSAWNLQNRFTGWWVCRSAGRAYLRHSRRQYGWPMKVLMSHSPPPGSRRTTVCTRFSDTTAIAHTIVECMNRAVMVQRLYRGQ